MTGAEIAILSAVLGGAMVQGGMQRAAQEKQAKIGRTLTGLEGAMDIEQAGFKQAQQQQGLAMKDYINSLRATLER